MNQYDKEIAKFEVEILNGTKNVADALQEFTERVTKSGHEEYLAEAYFLLAKYYLTRELNRERIEFISKSWMNKVQPLLHLCRLK